MKTKQVEVAVSTVMAWILQALFYTCVIAAVLFFSLPYFSSDRIWIAPQDLQQYERGDAKLFVRPDQVFLIFSPFEDGKIKNGEISYVAGMWKGIVGHAWPMGFHTWSRRVPVPGPNWRISASKLVFMEFDDLKGTNTKTTSMVEFGEDFLVLHGQQFEKVDVEENLYCGLTRILSIQDYQGSRC